MDGFSNQSIDRLFDARKTSRAPFGSVRAFARRSRMRRSFLVGSRETRDARATSNEDVRPSRHRSRPVRKTRVPPSCRVMTRHHTSVIIHHVFLVRTHRRIASSRRHDRRVSRARRPRPELSHRPSRLQRASRDVHDHARGRPVPVPAQYTSVVPCGAGVLVKVAAAEAVTKGGIVLTESAQRKPTSGA